MKILQQQEKKRDESKQVNAEKSLPLFVILKKVLTNSQSMVYLYRK